MRELDANDGSLDAGGELRWGIETCLDLQGGTRCFQVLMARVDFAGPPIEEDPAMARFFLESKGLGFFGDEPLEIDSAAEFDRVMEQAGCTLAEEAGDRRTWRLVPRTLKPV